MAILGEPGHRWLTALGPFDGDTALLDTFLSSGMIFDSAAPPVTTEQLEGAMRGLLSVVAFSFLLATGAGSPVAAAEMSVEEVTALLSRASREIPPDLSGRDLSGLDLSGLDFKAGNLRGANLKDAKLSGANLQGVELQKANLAGADLSKSIMDLAILRGANLVGANLSEVKAFSAVFAETDLRGANLSHINFLRS